MVVAPLTEQRWQINEAIAWKLNEVIYKTNQNDLRIRQIQDILNRIRYPEDYEDVAIYTITKQRDDLLVRVQELVEECDTLRADAELGALVRRMPVSSELHYQPLVYEEAWMMYVRGKHGARWERGDTPEEVLAAFVEQEGDAGEHPSAD